MLQWYDKNTHSIKTGYLYIWVGNTFKKKSACEKPNGILTFCQYYMATSEAGMGNMHILAVIF